MNESECEMNAFSVYLKQSILSFTSSVIVLQVMQREREREGASGGDAVCLAVYEAGCRGFMWLRVFYVAVCPVYVLLPLLCALH